MRTLLAALGLTLLIATPQAADAQWGNLVINGMQGSDYDMAREAARQKMDGKPVGHQEHWRNPETGNQGIAVLNGLEEHEGLPCRLVTHWFKVASTGERTSLNTRICKKDGRWLIAP